MRELNEHFVYEMSENSEKWWNRLYYNNHNAKPQTYHAV